MPAARVAFAGLSPLTEAILRAALNQRPELELVSPWTRLTSLSGAGTPGSAELLFVELECATLPSALRALLAAASPLRIVGLSPDARSATVFGLVEQRTVLLDFSPEQLCEAVSSPPCDDTDPRSGPVAGPSMNLRDH